MMYKRFFALFCFLSICFFTTTETLAQSRENEVDAQGRRQGAWKTYTPEGVLKFEGQFKDDKPFGTFTYYYADGKKRAVTTFEEGGKAHTEVYSKEGKKIADGNYIDKKRDGLWQFYSDFDGALISEEHYKDGQKEGEMINYYPDNGKIAEKVNFVKDWEDGPYYQYFEDGKIAAQGTYKAGMLVGDYKFFFMNGKVQLEGKYLNGQKEGDWHYYDKEGDLIKTEKFKAGKIVDVKVFKEIPEEEMKVIDEKELSKEMKK